MIIGSIVWVQPVGAVSSAARSICLLFCIRRHLRLGFKLMLRLLRFCDMRSFVLELFVPTEQLLLTEPWSRGGSNLFTLTSTSFWHCAIAFWT